MDNIKDNKTNTKVQLIIGILLGIVTLLGIVFITSDIGFSALAFFIDIPSLIGVVLICTSLVLCSGARNKEEICVIAQKVIIPSGVIIAMIAVTVLLVRLDNMEYIGPNLAVALLSIFYSVIIYSILVVINNKHRKNNIR